MFTVFSAADYVGLFCLDGRLPPFDRDMFSYPGEGRGSGEVLNYSCTAGTVAICSNASRCAPIKILVLSGIMRDHMLQGINRHMPLESSVKVMMVLSYCKMLLAMPWTLWRCRDLGQEGLHESSRALGAEAED